MSDRPGGGSGLPHSREMIERRGGELVLERAAPGEGATFAVRLRVLAGSGRVARAAPPFNTGGLK